MKTIYGVIAGLPSRINQKNTATPNLIAARMQQFSPTFDSHASMAHLVINLLTENTDNMLTNNEAFDHFLTYLEENKCTKIYDLYERYKLLVEYTLVDTATSKNIDQGILIEEVTVKDALYPLGCDSDNRLVYRQVKEFHSHPEMAYRSSRIMGVMYDSTRATSLQIKNITLLMDNKVQSTDPDFYENLHPSHLNVTLNSNFNRYGETVSSVLKTMTPIYDTLGAGIRFKDVVFPSRPRKIDINIGITWNELIVAYDESKVNAIIQTNIENAGGVVTPDDPGTGCGCDCDVKIEQISQEVQDIENTFNQYVINDVTDRIDESTIDTLFQ